MEGRVLIVRHGRRRGRLRRYMHEVLTHLRRHRPSIASRLVLHATGERPPSFDGVTAIVFWLADPLRQWYPECYGEAIDLTNEARRRGLRVINSPEALSNSVKSVQAEIWLQANIATPLVKRLERFDDLRSASDRFKYPVILRGDEQHAQRGMRVCGDRAELLAVDPAEVAFPCAVSPLVDVRAGYRDRDGDSIWARLYHKKRLIVAGDVIRTKHVFFSEQPIVSAKSSLFAKYKLRSRLPFAPEPKLLPVERACVAEDVAYWKRGEEHGERILQACRTLGLAFCAIDYSSLADGSVILWEANPHFRLPRLRDVMLPKQRLAKQRVASYYDAIGDFLRNLTFGKASPQAESHDREKCAA